MKTPQTKKKKLSSLLEFGKVCLVADSYKSTLIKKLRFEINFFIISFYSLLMQTLSFQRREQGYLILVYGALLMFKRILNKLNEYQQIHDPLKTTWMNRGFVVFSVTFYLDFIYILIKLFSEAYTTTSIFITYQYLIYIFIGSKLKKEIYLYNQHQSTVDYYLKNTMFRLYDTSYLHLLIVLQALQPPEEQQTSLMSLLKWSTFSKPLLICMISNIYLFIMSIEYLINTKGEMLLQYARTLSLWMKLSHHEIDQRHKIVEWNANEITYDPSVIVHYNNNFYRLQNYYNSSPPENLKVIFIQLLFYDPKKAKRTLTVIFVLAVLILNITTFRTNPFGIVLYNLLAARVIVPQMR